MHEADVELGAVAANHVNLCGQPGHRGQLPQRPAGDHGGGRVGQARPAPAARPPPPAAGQRPGVRGDRITADPFSVAPLPEAVAALRSLAGLPETTAAVISGRALRELAVMSRLPGEVHLVGSHGSEFDVGFVHALDEQAPHAALQARDSPSRS